MGEQGPTDFLAFPMDELRPPHLGGNRTDPDPGADPGLLGDVVLCPQVAAEQAEKAGHSTQDELEMLCVHGILHLLGFDHAEPEEHAAMFGTQDQLLKVWRDTNGRPGL
jgi:probable rRNA maturation factor